MPSKNGEHSKVVSRIGISSNQLREDLKLLYQIKPLLCIQDKCESKGHLIAFYFANQAPGFVAKFFKGGLKFVGGRIKAVVRQSLLAALIVLIVLLFILSKSSILYYFLPIVSFVIFLWLLNIVFSFLWLLNSRFTEYRQDAFAHRLGFGPDLKRVLLKIVETNAPLPVDQYSTLIRSTHHVLHNRIRRLEKLAGLRK